MSENSSEVKEKTLSAEELNSLSEHRVRGKDEPPDPKYLLEVRHLCKYFPLGANFFGKPTSYLRAVDDISFGIERGKTIGVVGESGCGKTTLGRTILRLYDITSGQFFFDGKDLAKVPPKELRKMRVDMQLIFQDPYSSLPPRMTVGAIISEAVKVHHIVPKDKVNEHVLNIMKMCGLQPQYYDRYPHEFSGGQRQRICIARALAVNPKLVICDEPVSALDVSIQAQIINLLKQLQNEMGLTYVFISHDLSVVKYITDKIAVMYLGNMMELGNTNDIFANPLHPYTQALFSAVPIPDPDVKMNRIILKGDIPSPANPPAGCKFHTRCSKCSTEQMSVPVSMQSMYDIACLYDIKVFQCVAYAVVACRVGNVIGCQPDLLGGGAHSHSHSRIAEHGYVVAAVAESHCLPAVETVMRQHLFDARRLVGVRRVEVGGNRVPAACRAVVQIRHYALLLLLIHVQTHLYYLLSAAKGFEVGELGYGQSHHFGQRPYIVVYRVAVPFLGCQHGHRKRVCMQHSEQRLDTAPAETAFVDDMSVCCEAIASVGGYVSVEVYVRYACGVGFVASGRHEQAYSAPARRQKCRKRRVGNRVGAEIHQRAVYVEKQSLYHSLFARVLFHGVVHVAFGVFLFEILSFVETLASARQTDDHLCQPALVDEHAKAHHRKSRVLRGACEAHEFAFLKQQLAVAFGAVVVVCPPVVFGDVHALDIQLPAVEVAEAVHQRGLA